jgi:hypothetical protein
MERARELYAKEGQHSAPVEAIVSYWGYGPKSSGGLGTLAALKKFGLLEDDGTRAGRVAHLTDLAIDALQHPDADRRREAIRQAALLPTIHAEMWQAYGPDLPSEDRLRFWLRRERGFTDKGASDFVGEYLATLLFAGLDRASLDGLAGDADEAWAAQVRPRAARDERSRPADVVSSPGTAEVRSTVTVEVETLTIPIPLVGAQPVQLTGKFPIPERAWNQLLQVLEAMKPGLVEQPVAAEDVPAT